MPDPKRVLLVCAGNTCRSPMAAALLDRLLSSRGVPAEVRSAGVCVGPGRQVHRYAVASLAEVDLNVLSTEGQALTQPLVDWADAIVLVERSLELEVLEDFPGAAAKLVYLDADVRDPYNGPLDEYRAAREQLEALLERLVDRWEIQSR